MKKEIWSMAEVTFHYIPVVCICIACSDEEVYSADYVFVGRFKSWMLKNKILALRGDRSGSNYVGYFRPEDAVKIKAWLIERGAKETK